MLLHFPGKYASHFSTVMPLIDPLDGEIEPDDDNPAAVQAAKYVRAERRMRHWFAKLVRVY